LFASREKEMKNLRRAGDRFFDGGEEYKFLANPPPAGFLFL